MITKKIKYFLFIFCQLISAQNVENEKSLTYLNATNENGETTIMLMAKNSATELYQNISHIDKDIDLLLVLYENLIRAVKKDYYVNIAENINMIFEPILNYNNSLNNEEFEKNIKKFSFALKEQLENTDLDNYESYWHILNSDDKIAHRIFLSPIYFLYLHNYDIKNIIKNNSLKNIRYSIMGPKYLLINEIISESFKFFFLRNGSVQFLEKFLESLKELISSHMVNLDYINLEFVNCLVLKKLSEINSLISLSDLGIIYFGLSIMKQSDSKILGKKLYKNIRKIFNNFLEISLNFKASRLDINQITRSMGVLSIDLNLYTDSLETFNGFTYMLVEMMPSYPLEEWSNVDRNIFSLMLQHINQYNKILENISLRIIAIELEPDIDEKLEKISKLCMMDDLIENKKNKKSLENLIEETIKKNNNLSHDNLQKLFNCLEHINSSKIKKLLKIANKK